ncbi:hypothetical protein Tco_0844414 [Tanacetum coccineum]
MAAPQLGTHAHPLMAHAHPHPVELAVSMAPLGLLHRDLLKLVRGQDLFSSLIRPPPIKATLLYLFTDTPDLRIDGSVGITSIMVKGKRAYELKGKFLDDLSDNASSGTNGEDAVEHIEYFLKIVDLINLLNMNYERLRLSVFLISL